MLFSFTFFSIIDSHNSLEIKKQINYGKNSKKDAFRTFFFYR